MMKKILGVIAGFILIFGLSQSGYAAGPTCDYDADVYAEIASEYTGDDGCIWIDVSIPLPGGIILHRTICLNCPDCYN